MINNANMKIVLDAIAAAAPAQCDMNEWRCNSVMCIGGTTEHIMFNMGLLHDVNNMANDYAVNEFLGLSDREADRLFYEFPERTPESGWKAWMLARVQRVIDTGTVERWRDIEEMLPI